MKISRLAKKASKSNVKKHKLVAFGFTKTGTQVAFGVNQKGSGRSSLFSIHAEEALVKKLYRLKAKERLGPISVLVLRTTKLGRPALSKPCDRCEVILKSYGIKKIGYTTNNGDVAYL